MKEALTFLDSIYPLSESAREYLCKNLKEIEVSKKEYILKQGRICYDIYFVGKGFLRCFYNKNDK
ncbi:MAG: hypothetical protein M3139_14720, partial [Bacteroidota bacterium]|nr:hypothetical protein [Bacteroidota bacterium]